MDLRILLPTTLVAAWLASTALAQPSADRPLSTIPAQPPLSAIRVTATATLHAKPDRVEIDIGVVTQGSQAGPAAAENAAHLQAVLATLHEAVGNEADIKTVSYTLTPNYRYPGGGAEPEITGYTATHIVRITLDDLDKMGTVIDVATRAGANRVQDIRFMLRDPEHMHLEALREAAVKARAEADALASALGVTVSRVLSVEEGGGYVVPIHPVRLAIARAEAAPEPTPIQAGTLDVDANVTLSVEVGGQHQLTR